MQKARGLANRMIKERYAGRRFVEEWGILLLARAARGRVTGCTRGPCRRVFIAASAEVTLSSAMYSFMQFVLALGSL